MFGIFLSSGDFCIIFFCHLGIPFLALPILCGFLLVDLPSSPPLRYDAKLTGSRKAGVWRGVIVAVGAGFMWLVGDRVGNILMMMVIRW